MTPERLQQIESIYQFARSRNHEERDAFLSAACGKDRELRQEVESLLDFQDGSAQFVTGAGFRMAAEGRAEPRGRAPSPGSGVPGFGWARCSG